eukprot:gene7581-8184_t
MKACLSWTIVRCYSILLSLIVWLWYGESAYQIPEKNLTLDLIIEQDDGGIPLNLTFLFNSHDNGLIDTTNLFCYGQSLPESVCERIFQHVIEIRYDYVEGEMIKLELAKNVSVINTQFIPNKHLLRSAYSINTEINNRLKETTTVSVDFENRLSPIIQDITSLLKSLFLNEIQEENRECNDSIIAMRKNIAFIHSCSIEQEGNRILMESLNRIIQSGLIHELSYLFIINYGIGLVSSVSSLIEEYSNIIVFHVSHDTSFFEVPTMKIIQESFQLLNTNITMNILYLHTKGVSYREIYAQIDDWRHFMLYFLVERYKVCLSLLESGEYDSLGVNYKTNPRDYRGNFWWTTSSYMVKLPYLDLRYTNKYTAEKWVHVGERYRVYSFHESVIDHHRDLYPRERYEVKNGNVVLPQTSDGIQYSAVCLGATVYWRKNSSDL